MAAFCESVAVMALNAEGASMHMFRCGSWLAGASCAGTLFLATGGAAVAGSADDWQYSGTLYLWGAGINAETARGSTVDIDFTTLLNNLNMAAMGALEARRREWSFVADAIYLNVGGDNEASVPVFGFDVAADVKARAWILNLHGAYNVFTSEQASIDLLAGARYLELKIDLSVDVAAGPQAVTLSRSVLDNVWDGVVGVKGRVNLGDRWYLPYYADIGTGESDLTWQVFAGVAYSFDWGEMSLVYRHAEWEFDDNKLDNLQVSGPAAAVTWNF